MSSGTLKQSENAAASQVNVQASPVIGSSSQNCTPTGPIVHLIPARYHKNFPLIMTNQHLQGAFLPTLAAVITIVLNKSLLTTTAR